jgi:hypothetical protein
MTVEADGKVTRKQITAILFIVILLFIISAEVGLRFISVSKGTSFFFPFQKVGKKAKPFIPYRTFGFKLYQTINDVRYISSRH